MNQFSDQFERNFEGKKSKNSSFLTPEFQNLSDNLFLILGLFLVFGDFLISFYFCITS